MYKLTAALVLLCLITLGGCAGGSSGTGTGGGQFTTGVKTTTVLSSISMQEYDQICDSTNQFVEELLDNGSLCTFLGVTLATFFSSFDEASTQSSQSDWMRTDISDQSPEQMCSTVRQECLQAIKGPRDIGYQCVVASREDTSDCHATVGELEACLQDTFDLMATAFNSLTCDNLNQTQTLNDATTAFSGVSPSAACMALQQSCPHLITTREVAS